METTLEKRAEIIRQKVAKFEISSSKIGAACIPPKPRTTVAKVITGSDPRYITEGNVAAIETAVESILEEYRKDLCGK